MPQERAERCPGQDTAPPSNESTITSLQAAGAGAPARLWANKLAVAAAPDGIRRSISDLPEAIAKRVTVHPVSGCWVVGGYCDKNGYARIGGDLVHRVVWQRLVGEIPRRLVLDHREDWGCVSKACAYPGHLLPVTVRVNTLRGRSFAAVNAAKDECIHGHPFDLLGTYWKPNGHRDCRACIRDRVKRYRRRKRAAQLADAAQAPAALGRAA